MLLIFQCYFSILIAAALLSLRVYGVTFGPLFALVTGVVCTAINIRMLYLRCKMKEAHPK